MLTDDDIKRLREAALQVVPMCRNVAGATIIDLIDRLEAAERERDEAETALRNIGDFAHDRSTGPAVPDALWGGRSMAYDALAAKGQR
jgi:hypothetical protein